MNDVSELFKESPIRTLARTSKWLTIYLRAKEIGSIKLFENQSDFTQLQITFLQYLENISSLYFDLSLGEEFISDEVIVDWLRSECYLLYKRKKKEEKKLKKNIPDNKSNDSIVFVSKRK